MKNCTIKTDMGTCDLHFFWYKGYRCLVKTMKTDPPPFPLNYDLIQLTGLDFNKWFCGYVCLPKRQNIKIVRKYLQCLPGGKTYDKKTRMDGDYKIRHWVGFDTMHPHMEVKTFEDTVEAIKISVDLINILAFTANKTNLFI